MTTKLAPSAAVAANVLATVCYVGFLYLIPGAVKKLPRDVPLHIQYRMAVVTATSVLTLLAAGCCMAAMDVRLPSHNQALAASTSYLWHFALSSGWDVDLWRAARSVGVTVLLMCLFYLGPLTVLLARVVTQCGYRTEAATAPGSTTAGPLVLVPREVVRSPLAVFGEVVESNLCLYSNEALLRNLVVGPVTEEIVFRSVVVALGVAANCVQEQELHGGENEFSACVHSVCLWSPAYFALAHVHHCYEQLRQAGVGWRQQVPAALVRMAVQATYTSIFGVIAALLMVRTGSVMSSIASHMICNCMQLPDVSFAADPSGGLNPHFYLHPYRHLLLLLHGLGLLFFAAALFPVTEQLAATSVLWGGSVQSV